MSKPHFNDANIDIYSETTKLFNIFLWNINTEAQSYRGLFSLELRVESQF